MCANAARPSRGASQAIEDKDDIFGFLKQSHISERNVALLEQMAKSDNPQVANLAAIVLEVARVKPYRTRRLKFLAERHPELLGKLRDTNLIVAHDWWDTGIDLTNWILSTQRNTAVHEGPKCGLGNQRVRGRSADLLK